VTKGVAFDGSAARDGRIAVLLRTVLAELEAAGIQTEYLYLEKDRRTGCYMCGQCAHKRDSSCSRPAEDGLRRCARRVLAADGLVVGSPAYAAGFSPATQALFQRLEHAGRGDSGRLSSMVAAAVVDPRRPGAARTAARLGAWFTASGMLVVDAPGAGGPHAAEGGPHAAEDADGGAESVVRLARTLAGLLERTGG
jgi:multimeric flavodoxin WrbA